jgi:putative alpha-1,2-mannosidase
MAFRYVTSQSSSKSLLSGSANSPTRSDHRANAGGRQAAAERLDRFTTQLNAGPDEPYLWMVNEPNFGVPWLYNYVGQPWKTQQTVDRVRSQLFGPTPGGEPGNDDLGALSSWYVWAALGLYPSTPGTPILTVNTPLFDRAE